MLKLDNVQKQYNKFQLNCSLSIEPGTVIGLIGANGAGKSTTFKAILDLISYDSGSISIFGKDSTSLTPEDRENIGVVMGNHGFNGGLTILNIVSILSSLYTHFDQANFLSQCEDFKLPLKKKTKEFSTGMMARLNLLIAINHNARLLILDEPTAGLDAIAREDILNLLRKYMEDESRAILISSHISNDLENFCDQIYMIHDGQIILHEDTDVLLEQYGLMKVDESTFETLDKSRISYIRKESYGFQCLTTHKSFYLDNYPDIIIEKNNIDEFLNIVERGTKL